MQLKATIQYLIVTDTVTTLALERDKRQAEDCTGKNYRCLDGQCIEIIAVCDGRVDCRDGSDETQLSCSKYQLKCPDYDFTCKYGACISHDKRCNGLKECADNSDEENCQEERSSTEKQVDCGPGKFLCGGGRCIDRIHTCDGYDDCWEEIFLPPEARTNVSSDETIALCINRRCPKFAFQCAYGGCIDSVKKCDGIDDCNDKSDEDEELCNLPIDTRNPSNNIQGRCEVIKSPNLIVSCSIAGFSVDCNIPAKEGTNMNIKCKHGFHKNYFNSFSIDSVCLENGHWHPWPHDDCTVCGKRYALGNFIKLISHAETTKFLEYPWHAGLYESLPEKVEYLCGGSIIHPRAILTAAHCVYEDKISDLKNTTYEVAVGKYNSSWDYTHPLEQRIKVKSVYIAENYLGLSSRYQEDIAILQLEKDIVFNTAVTAVCIDWQDGLKLYQKKNALATVVGWGRTETGQVSELPRYAKFRYYAFRSCRESAVETFETFVTPDKFCAGLGNDTIVQRGDSGGGLTFPFINSDKREENYIYGIVSIKDQESNDLAAFTNVSQYLNWIDGILNLIINDSIKTHKLLKAKS